MGISLGPPRALVLVALCGGACGPSLVLGALGGPDTHGSCACVAPVVSTDVATSYSAVLPNECGVVLKMMSCCTVCMQSLHRRAV